MNVSKIAAPRLAHHAARPRIEWLARAGYAAKGVLYLTIGALASLLALGEREGRATDSEGALRALGDQPFGAVLLVAMAVGLAGHALWRLVQGTLDPEGEVRRSRHPVAQRASFLVRGVLHVGLAIYAVKTALGEATRGGSASSLTAKVMGFAPAGVWIVAAAGAIVLGFGLLQIKKALGREVGTELRLGRIRPALRSWVVRLGRVGTAARGAVLGLIGGSLIVAALRFDPREAKGLGETLSSLGSTAGSVVLLVAALGLVAYGAYQLAVAKLRVIRA